MRQSFGRGNVQTHEISNVLGMSQHVTFTVYRFTPGLV